MKRGWLVAAGAFFALFAGTIYLSLKLPLLDALGPGPGFFPLILSLIGAALALVLIVSVGRQPHGPAGPIGADASESLVPDGGAILRLSGIVILLLAAFTALDPLGYRLTALAFVVLVLLVLGARNYLAIALVAIAFSFGVFHTFYYWLKVPLPIGSFGL